MDTLSYDIDTIEIPVELKSKTKNKIWHLMLTEASEPAAARYQNAQIKATKMIESADGSRIGSIDGLSDTEALLVSMCLFEVTPEGGRKSLDQAWIKANIPHRVCKELFAKAEEISGLAPESTKEQIVSKIKALQKKLDKLNAGETQETELKNSQSATETGSA